MCKDKKEKELRAHSLLIRNVACVVDSVFVAKALVLVSIYYIHCYKVLLTVKEAWSCWNVGPKRSGRLFGSS